MSYYIKTKMSSFDAIMEQMEAEDAALAERT